MATDTPKMRASALCCELRAESTQLDKKILQELEWISHNAYSVGYTIRLRAAIDRFARRAYAAIDKVTEHVPPTSNDEE